MASTTGFTIHHLPYGVITTPNNNTPHLATAYQDYAIDLATLVNQGLLKGNADSTVLKHALSHQTWNTFATLPPEIRQSFRTDLKQYIQSLRTIPPPDTDTTQNTAWHSLTTITLHYPMQTQNYSDFYCSHEHAQNCSAIFNLPISQTWFTIPQVYNGRTSSLAVTNTPITRPMGIFPSASNNATTPPKPTFAPEPKLDFELEMGVFISHPIPRGTRLSLPQAKTHIFGIALLNDWSARTIQFFEIQPLGPFHSKGALTSVAGWITPIEALNEFAVSPRHSRQEPAPMPHLTNKDEEAATWNIHVSASVVRNGKEYRFSVSNLNELHWTPLQMITYLASAGEGLSTGDIFGTGTLSSARTNSNGEKIGLSCIWERQLKGARLSSLPEGIETGLLEDGDEVVLRGWVGGAGEDPENEEGVVFRLGECRGVVLPAVLAGVGEV